jgi:transposase-like protein
VGGRPPHPGGRGFEGAPVAAKPDPEVLEKPVRRRLTVEYKLRILAEADACERVRGQLGALLRREGLYASQLKTWRTQRAQGTLLALAPRKRGRKQQASSPLVQENRRLERENRHARPSANSCSIVSFGSPRLRGAALKAPFGILARTSALRLDAHGLCVSAFDLRHSFVIRASSFVISNRLFLALFARWRPGRFAVQISKISAFLG